MTESARHLENFFVKSPGFPEFLKNTSIENFHLYSTTWQCINKICTTLEKVSIRNTIRNHSKKTGKD